ncbi:MAG: glycosyltransferase family 2 protein [Bacteroidales bacterium]|nr:glycosyltransferase family 2 protein [Bacteroidales bacterium]
MKISIIIPTYNVLKYISRCIDSCISQSYKDVEIVIVDDCSTDGTFEIIENYAEKYRNIKIFRNTENNGVHFTRTYGVQHAIGDYVFLLDGDDFIPVDALESLSKKWDETNADIIDGDFVFVNENGNQQENNNSYSFDNLLDSENYLLLLLRNKALYQTFKLIRRSLFDFVKIKQKLTIGEDAVSVVQMIKSATMIAKVNKIVYFYYRRTDSVTVLPRKQNLIDVFFASELVVKEIQSMDKRFSEEIKKIRIMNVVNYINNYHITNSYRNNIRMVLMRNFSFDRLIVLKFSSRTKFASMVCFISPALANRVLHNKFILF